MLGVGWRGLATGSRARPAPATASAGVVLARVTVRRSARTRELTVSVTALSAVARKPTSRRLASGPRETGSARTGLYSGNAGVPAGAAATQRLVKTAGRAGTSAPR